MAKVAVIVPVYNVEPYLRRCVDSILSQTFRDFELFLVDDGSTDGSGAVCDDYAAMDTRVRVIHQTNKGLSAARNAVLDLLDTDKSGAADYVTFVDSDDWVAEVYLEELFRGIAAGSEISSVPLLRACDDTAGVFGGLVLWRTMSPRKYWLIPAQNQSAACGKLYARRLFEGIRYPVGRINEDEYTTYKVFFRADRVSCTDSSLYAYYIRPGSIMRSAWSKLRLDRLDAYREQMAFFSGRGFPELAENSRKWLVVDLVEAVRQLSVKGESELAESYRRQLLEQLKAGRFPFTLNYLAYKTACPFKARALKLLSLLCGGTPVN